MKITRLLCAATLCAASIATTGAQAATLPVSVEAMQGAIAKPGPLPGRNDPNNAIAGPDGAFFSLGLGGLAVFDFGALLSGAISLSEVTFDCKSGGPECQGHAESVEIRISDTYQYDLDVAGFTSLGVIGNAEAQGAKSVMGSGFRYVALIDVSPQDGGSFDGFDIDALSVIPIPLPLPGMLLASALFGVVILRRKRVA